MLLNERDDVNKSHQDFSRDVCLHNFSTVVNFGWNFVFRDFLSFLQIAKQTNRQTKNRKFRARKRFLATWYRHQNICQPTEIFLATILWLKYKLCPYFYKTNETKLNEFLKPKHAYMYLSFVIFYLRLKKTAIETVQMKVYKIVSALSIETVIALKKSKQNLLNRNKLQNWDLTKHDWDMAYILQY